MPQKEGMNVLYHQASNTLFFTIVYGPGIFNLIFVKHGFSYYQWNQVKHQFSETIILRKNFYRDLLYMIWPNFYISTSIYDNKV
jgi:hypothetical protein